MERSTLFDRLHARATYTHAEHDDPPGDAVWIERVCEKLCELIGANALTWEDALTIGGDVELWPVHCGGRCCAREDGGCYAYDAWQPFKKQNLYEQHMSDLVRLGYLVFAEEPPRPGQHGQLQRVLALAPTVREAGDGSFFVAPD